MVIFHSYVNVYQRVHPLISQYYPLSNTIKEHYYQPLMAILNHQSDDIYIYIKSYKSQSITIFLWSSYGFHPSLAIPPDPHLFQLVAGRRGVPQPLEAAHLHGDFGPRAMRSGRGRRGNHGGFMGFNGI